MNNYQDAAVGKRIKLLGTMLNPDSNWMPVEDIPIGTEGTIVFVNIHGDRRYDQIGVVWDNDRSLCIFPYKDHYEIFNGSPVAQNAV